jgi:hypothetical protein
VFRIESPFCYSEIKGNAMPRPGLGAAFFMGFGMTTKQRAREWRAQHDALVTTFAAAARQAQQSTHARPSELAAALLDTARAFAIEPGGKVAA